MSGPQITPLEQRLNAEANELLNRAEAAEAKVVVLEAALRRIAGPSRLRHRRPPT